MQQPWCGLPEISSLLSNIFLLPKDKCPMSVFPIYWAWNRCISSQNCVQALQWFVLMFCSISSGLLIISQIPVPLIESSGSLHSSSSQSWWDQVFLNQSWNVKANWWVGCDLFPRSTVWEFQWVRHWNGKNFEAANLNHRQAAIYLEAIYFPIIQGRKHSSFPSP